MKSFKCDDAIEVLGVVFNGVNEDRCYTNIVFATNLMELELKMNMMSST